MAVCAVYGMTGSWKFPLVLGTIAMLVGLLFLFFPDFSVSLVIYSAAFITLIASGILIVVALLSSRGSGGFFLVPLGLGILTFLIAVVCFLYPELVASFVSVLIGAVCVLGGLGWVFTAGLHAGPGTRRLPGVTGGFILTALGLLILLHPQLTLPVIFRLIGIFLIAAGFVSVISGLVILRRERSPDPRVIDVYIEE